MPVDLEKKVRVGSTVEEFFACDLQPWRLNRSIAGNQNEAHARKIASNFDEAAFGYLAVCRHNGGSLTIIDGHNRLRALEILGHEDYIVTCEVFEGLADAEIAEIFVGRGQRKAMDAITMFLNQQVAGVDEAVAITNILAELDLYVAASRSHTDHAVPAVMALRKVYRMPGVYAKRGEALRATLSLLMEAWGGGDSMAGQIIEGVGMFMARYGREIDAQGLARRLSEYPKGPRELLANARGVRDLHGGSVAHSVAWILTGQYNKSRRSGRLPDWR